MGLQSNSQDNSDVKLAINPQKRTGHAFDNKLASAADPILRGASGAHVTRAPGKLRSNTPWMPSTI